jgi:predicted nuclease of predicted toxin-antitoxin system
MKILFDQGTPVPLRRHLTGHVVDTVFERGWSNLENGELLDAAERDGYGLLITTDQNLKYQQNLSARQLAILVLLSTSWPRIQRRIDDIQAAVGGIGPGDYTEIPI